MPAQTHSGFLSGQAIRPQFFYNDKVLSNYDFNHIDNNICQ